MDGTCDHWGTFCYIRDVESGEFWSTAHQPTLERPERYEAIFTEARADFRRRVSAPLMIGLAMRVSQDVDAAFKGNHGNPHGDHHLMFAGGSPSLSLPSRPLQDREEPREYTPASEGRRRLWSRQLHPLRIVAVGSGSDRSMIPMRERPRDR